MKSLQICNMTTYMGGAKRLFDKIRKIFMSPERYAQYIGVNIGENNYVPDKDTWSSEPYLIAVGNNCQITRGVRILTHGGGQVMRDVYPDYDGFGKVKIGSYVYIGNNALIMPGVTIGDNSLIAAGSGVTKSIPARVVVAGVPARIVCTIEEYIERNAKYNAHTKGMSSTEKREKLQKLPENCFIVKPFMKK